MSLFKQITEKYWVLADQVVVSGSAFLTNLLLAKAMGLPEYGKFSIMVMVQLFILSVSMAFSSQVYQVNYPSLAANDQKKLTRGMLGIQFMVAALILMMALLGFSIWHISGFKAMSFTTEILIMATLSTVLYLLQDFLRRVFITKTEGRNAFLIDSLTNILQITALLLAWHFNLLGQAMAWSIIGLSFLPSVVCGIVLLKPEAITFADIRFSWKLQLVKGGWLIGSSLLQWGSGYFFVIAAGWWLGAAALGALRLAQYIFGLLNLLLQAIENYVLPKVVAIKADMSVYWWQLMRKSLVMIVPILCLLSLFANDIFSIIGGPEYQQYTFIIYGLSIVYLLITIGYPVRIAIRSLELNRAYFIGYILSVSTGLMLAPWLIKTWGIQGVLAGIFLTQLIMICYWSIILQRKYSILWKSYI
ncbi:lipopolysaccharide biosynthesis protein [Pedobacter polysacchareus]|uniref:lipopolysaccharide biosynthesis protein n=1 Tax=Pedobacter polysacchareus TaxID=2861973 RepID=UPI001C99A0FC|nr:hypothetical protein [Pedobacter polysacchareus]